jgi:hypothetical protein
VWQDKRPTMPIETTWGIPFIPTPANLALDSYVSFVVSALLAIMINAEAQAWVATTLGDTRPDAKDRFHFNVLFHMSFLGSLCYLVAGFGWPKTMDIDPTKFKRPRLYLIITRLAGPLANILLANVAASLVFAIRFVELDPLVFMMVVGVNVTTAVYHLLPIPPLAVGLIILSWLPESLQRFKWLINLAGPVLIVSIFLVERLTGQGIISPYLNPLIWKVVRILAG